VRAGNVICRVLSSKMSETLTKLHEFSSTVITQYTLTRIEEEDEKIHINVRKFNP
jgi:hypothetical protein